jgi:hypothetical protein
VVIAAAAAVITYIWISSYLGSAGRGVEAPQFRELLKVEGVRVEGGSARDNVVWESSTIQWKGGGTHDWEQFTQTFTVNVSGKVTLKITLTVNVKKVGASIDVQLDNVSLLASASP